MECNCRGWCRTWGETMNFKYPPSNHAPGCNLYKQELFKVVEYDRSRMVIEPRDLLDLISDDPSSYKVTDIMLTRDQFEKMEEHSGF